MAVTTVHVILTGIVSLIPAPPGNSYLVRLQDARHADHFPDLLVETSRVAQQRPALPQPDLQQGLSDGDQLAVWKLANGVIEVLTPIRESVLTENLSNVLEIDDGSGGICDTADADFRGVDLQVPAGTLTTTRRSPLSWFYESESPEMHRVLAQEVCWSFTIDQPILDLNLPGLGRVSLSTPPQGGDIELRLQNVLDADRIPSPPLLGVTDDFHVRVYYEQCLPEPPTVASGLIRSTVLPALESMAALPAHPAHRLAGDAIVERLPPPAANGTIAALRLNCPPAKWRGKARRSGP